MTYRWPLSSSPQIQLDLPLAGGHLEGWTVFPLPPNKPPKIFLHPKDMREGRVDKGLNSKKILNRSCWTLPKPLMSSVCGIVYLSDTNIWHIDNITVIRNAAAVVWIKRKSGEKIGADRALWNSPHSISSTLNLWVLLPSLPRISVTKV